MQDRIRTLQNIDFQKDQTSSIIQQNVFQTRSASGPDSKQLFVDTTQDTSDKTFDEETAEQSLKKLNTEINQLLLRTDFDPLLDDPEVDNCSVDQSASKRSKIVELIQQQVSSVTKSTEREGQAKKTMSDLDVFMAAFKSTIDFVEKSYKNPFLTSTLQSVYKYLLKYINREPRQQVAQTTALQQLDNKCTALQTENDQLKQRLLLYSRQLQELKETNKQLLQSDAAQTVKIEQLTTEVGTHLNVIQRMKVQIQQQEKAQIADFNRIQEFRSRLKRAQNQVTLQKEQISDKNIELQREQQKVNSEMVTASKMQEEIERQQQLIISLQSQLEEAHQQISEYAIRTQMAQNEVNEISSKISNLQVNKSVMGTSLVQEAAKTLTLFEQFVVNNKSEQEVTEEYGITVQGIQALKDILDYAKEAPTIGLFLSNVKREFMYRQHVIQANNSKAVQVDENQSFMTNQSFGAQSNKSQTDLQNTVVQLQQENIYLRELEEYLQEKLHKYCKNLDDDPELQQKLSVIAKSSSKHSSPVKTEQKQQLRNNVLSTKFDFMKNVNIELQNTDLEHEEPPSDQIGTTLNESINGPKDQEVQTDESCGSAATQEQQVQVCPESKNRTTQTDEKLQQKIKAMEEMDNLTRQASLADFEDYSMNVVESKNRQPHNNSPTAHVSYSQSQAQNNKLERSKNKQEDAPLSCDESTLQSRTLADESQQNSQSIMTVVDSTQNNYNLNNQKPKNQVTPAVEVPMFSGAQFGLNRFVNSEAQTQVQNDDQDVQVEPQFDTHDVQTAQIQLDFMQSPQQVGFSGHEVSQVHQTNNPSYISKQNIQQQQKITELEELNLQLQVKLSSMEQQLKQAGTQADKPADTKDVPNKIHSSSSVENFNQMFDITTKRNVSTQTEWKEPTSETGVAETPQIVLQIKSSRESHKDDVSDDKALTVVQDTINQVANSNEAVQQKEELPQQQNGELSEAQPQRGDVTQNDTDVNKEADKSFKGETRTVPMKETADDITQINNEAKPPFTQQNPSLANKNTVNQDMESLQPETHPNDIKKGEQPKTDDLQSAQISKTATDNIQHGTASAVDQPQPHPERTTKEKTMKVSKPSQQKREEQINNLRQKIDQKSGQQKQLEPLTDQQEYDLLREIRRIQQRQFESQASYDTSLHQSNTSAVRQTAESSLLDRSIGNSLDQNRSISISVNNSVISPKDERSESDSNIVLMQGLFVQQNSSNNIVEKRTQYPASSDAEKQKQVDAISVSEKQIIDKLKQAKLQQQQRSEVQAKCDANTINEASECSQQQNMKQRSLDYQKQIQPEQSLPLSKLGQIVNFSLSQSDISQSKPSSPMQTQQVFQDFPRKIQSPLHQRFSNTDGADLQDKVLPEGSIADSKRAEAEDRKTNREENDLQPTSQIAQSSKNLIVLNQLENYASAQDEITRSRHNTRNTAKVRRGMILQTPTDNQSRQYKIFQQGDQGQLKTTEKAQLHIVQFKADPRDTDIQIQQLRNIITSQNMQIRGLQQQLTRSANRLDSVQTSQEPNIGILDEQLSEPNYDSQDKSHFPPRALSNYNIYANRQYVQSNGPQIKQLLESKNLFDNQEQSLGQKLGLPVKPITQSRELNQTQSSINKVRQKLKEIEQKEQYIIIRSYSPETNQSIQVSGAPQYLRQQKDNSQYNQTDGQRYAGRMQDSQNQVQLQMQITQFHQKLQRSAQLLEHPMLFKNSFQIKLTQTINNICSQGYLHFVQKLTHESSVEKNCVDEFVVLRSTLASQKHIQRIFGYSVISGAEEQVYVCPLIIGNFNDFAGSSLESLTCQFSLDKQDELPKWKRAVINAFAQQNIAAQGITDVQISPRTTTIKPKILVPELGEDVQYLNVAKICKKGEIMIPIAVRVAEVLYGRQFNQINVDLPHSEQNIFVELPKTVLRSRSWLCKVLSQFNEYLLEQLNNHRSQFIEQDTALLTQCDKGDLFQFELHSGKVGNYTTVPELLAQFCLQRYSRVLATQLYVQILVAVSYHMSCSSTARTFSVLLFYDQHEYESKDLINLWSQFTVIAGSRLLEQSSAGIEQSYALAVAIFPGLTQSEIEQLVSISVGVQKRPQLDLLLGLYINCYLSRRQVLTKSILFQLQQTTGISYSQFRQLFEKLMYKYAIPEQYTRELFVLYSSYGQLNELSSDQLNNKITLPREQLLQLCTDLRLPAFVDMLRVSSIKYSPEELDALTQIIAQFKQSVQTIQSSYIAEVKMQQNFGYMKTNMELGDFRELCKVAFSFVLDGIRGNVTRVCLTLGKLNETVQGFTDGFVHKIAGEMTE